MERLTMNIAGMSCGHCVHTVTKALKDLDGVTVEKVAVGSATVSYDAGTTSLEQITDAVAEAGYEARPAGQAAGSGR
ncbi:MAG: heavy-metal-associated domain-containing protein [Gemmatimonadaceae bacterium]